MHQPRQPESKGRDRREDKTPANRAANGSVAGFGIVRHASDIQVHDFQRVVLDELAPRLNILAHQCRKNVLGGDRVF